MFYQLGVGVAKCSGKAYNWCRGLWGSIPLLMGIFIIKWRLPCGPWAYSVKWLVCRGGSCSPSRTPEGHVDVKHPQKGTSIIIFHQVPSPKSILLKYMLYIFYFQKMKEFLLPFCKICRTSFKSPMLYEAHICDLNHIRVCIFISVKILKTINIKK
jgi:hypothetical protein